MIDTITTIIIVRIGMSLDPKPNPIHIRINIITDLDRIPTSHLPYHIVTHPHPLIRTNNLRLKFRTVCKSLSNTKVCPIWEVCP